MYSSKVLQIKYNSYCLVDHQWPFSDILFGWFIIIQSDNPVNPLYLYFINEVVRKKCVRTSYISKSASADLGPNPPK